MQNLEFAFDNSYARLPARFYTKLPPTKVKAPELVALNEALARTLGLNPDLLRSDLGAEVFAGNQVPDGADPLAMAYAGHQFGSFVPQLGDGRAILLGEIVDRDGVRQDIQLKGAGRTPYSRGGDGRAALGPVLREYIVSGYMHAIGIPTTRSLAVAMTGEHVYREDILPGAVLTRVAESHLRVGTFEFFAARRDEEALKHLVDYALQRHFPDLVESTKPAQALLNAVLKRQCALVAKWLSVGFIHGVMNTDNTSIAGETIDYGPCAFMDTYRPDKVFSSIDHMGRYAFMNQPDIVQWNLSQLARCLLPLIDDDPNDSVSVATEIIQQFPEMFTNALSEEFARKLALAGEQKETLRLAFELLEVMSDQLADFTLTFRHLADALPGSETENHFLKQFENPAAVRAWLESWRARVFKDKASADDARQQLLAVNPAIIARNHLVEEVIRAGEDHGEFAPLHELMVALREPYAEQPHDSKYVRPPNATEEVKQTFCGT